MKLYILKTHTRDSSGEPLPEISLTYTAGFWRLDTLREYKTGEIITRWITPDEAATLLSQYNQFDPQMFTAWRSLPAIAREAWISRLPFGNNYFPGSIIPDDLQWIEDKLISG